MKEDDAFWRSSQPSFLGMPPTTLFVLILLMQNLSDPLTYTLMIDPVILPKGQQRIDRSSIVQHLLSDPDDPIS